MELASFENFIMHCCRLTEWDLRTYLKEQLSYVGFTFQEDKYKSSRAGRYRECHNLLFSRGEDPRVCLVAHTDVCRDHNGKHPPKVHPVVKERFLHGEEIRIIQDEFCRVQVGGDDRLGVAINTWIALNTGYDMSLLFTTEEEIGAISAEEANFDKFINFDLFVQVDRGNQKESQLVVNIGGVQLCNMETARRLLDIAYKMGIPREPVRGYLTDVVEIKRNFPFINAINMTCGYHSSFGADADEYIVIEEARDTMSYVSEIIKDYDLRDDNIIEDEIKMVIPITA